MPAILTGDPAGTPVLLLVDPLVEPARIFAQPLRTPLPRGTVAAFAADRAAGVVLHGRLVEDGRVAVVLPPPVAAALVGDGLLGVPDPDELVLLLDSPLHLARHGRAPDAA